MVTEAGTLVARWLSWAGPTADAMNAAVSAGATTTASWPHQGSHGLRGAHADVAVGDEAAVADLGPDRISLDRAAPRLAGAPPARRRAAAG